jgi:LacI family transcriptional regulator
MRVPVTMADIAKEAGTTVTTVSRALRDRPDINPGTKRRILELAKSMDYVPNSLASGLRTRRVPFIGAIIMDSANPFFAGVLRGIHDTAYAGNYQTVLCNTDFSDVREQEAIQLLKQLQVAGILLYPVKTNPEAIEDLLGSGYPVVLMGRYYENIQANCVIFDDPLAGYLATRHAIQRGYAKVAYLGGPRGTSATERRFQGYCRALMESDRPYDQSMVLWGGRGMQDGYDNFKRLMESHRPPLAVFCLNDMVAIGALRAAQELGFRVPDDVGIIGHDDNSLASVVSVPLTTLATSHYGMGQIATELLLDVLAGKEKPTGHCVVLEPHLVIRASC